MTFSKLILSGRVILSPQSSIIRPEILSGPCALLTFKLFMISKIDFCVIATVSRFEHEIWVKLGRVLSLMKGLTLIQKVVIK